jgi:hypothetical protein
MTIETKYNIGDEVWLMLSNKPRKVTIVGLLITKGDQRKSEKYTSQETRYNLHAIGEQSYEGFSEESLFFTKEDLIATL